MNQPDADNPFRRPPNYRSRRVQLRLMVLVSMFMLVLLAMDKARDPQTWAWMWSGETSPDAPESSRYHALGVLTEPVVNTELGPQPANSPDMAADEFQSGPPPLAEVPEDGSPEDRAVDDFWARMLQSLAVEEQLLLDRALFARRRGMSLNEAQRKQWPQVVEKLEAAGKSFFQNAKRATEHALIDDEQQRAWLALLAKQARYWQEETAPALGRLANPKPESDPENGEQDDKLFAAVQASLDRLSLAAIEDNTVQQAKDARAWFRFFEKLKFAKPAALNAAERVSFLPLFRQPQAYRGKLVSIRGKAKLAFTLNAPPNPYGIERYTVMWIRPIGATSPVIVYTLELPDGFPEVVDRNATGQYAARTELHDEEVDFTGYFFKNHAYKSEQGIRVAPMLLARRPEWLPTPPTAGAKKLRPWEISLYIATMGVVALILATLAFRSSQSVRARNQEPTKVAPTDLAALDAGSPTEQLERLRNEGK